MDDYEWALSQLRVSAKNNGQAWLTAQASRELLRRLADHNCDNCGDRCDGEVVRRLCDECVVVREASE